MSRKHAIGGEEGEIGKVLVINRIPLPALNESHKVGKLHRQDAIRSEQHLYTGDKIVQVWDVREHIVADQQIGAALRSQRLRGAPAEEFDPCRDSAFASDFGDICRRLDAKHWDLPVMKTAVDSRRLRLAP